MGKYFLNSKFQNKGVGMVEIIIAAAIIGIALVGLAGLSDFALRAQVHLKQNLIAGNLAIEAMEATKAVKQENWSNFSSLPQDMAYHPIKGGTPVKWSLVQGAETIDGFSRQIVIGRVLRDTDDDIIEAGGVADPDTRKITATVSWAERGKSYQVTLTSYLTNWKP